MVSSYVVSYYVVTIIWLVLYSKNCVVSIMWYVLFGKYYVVSYYVVSIMW